VDAANRSYDIRYDDGDEEEGVTHDFVRGCESGRAGSAGRQRSSSSVLGKRLAADPVPPSDNPDWIGKQRKDSRATRKRPAAARTEAAQQEDAEPPPDYVWRASQSHLSSIPDELAPEQIVAELELYVSRAARREKAGGWFLAGAAGQHAVPAEQPAPALQADAGSSSSAAPAVGLVSHVPSEVFVQAQIEAFVASVQERIKTKQRKKDEKINRMSEADLRGDRWREGVKAAQQAGRTIVWQDLSRTRTVPALSLAGKGHWHLVEDVVGLTQRTGEVFVVVRPYAEQSEGGRRPAGPRFRGSEGAGTFRGTPAEWKAKYQQEAPECNRSTPGNVTEWGRNAQRVWEEDPRKENPSGTAMLEQVDGYAPLESWFASGNTANGGIFSGTVPACPPVAHSVPHVTLHFTPVTRAGARLTCALVSSCPA